MIKFLFKTLLFSVFPIASLFGVFLLENGTADPFYQRFVTPKQEALILGNSKAAQGINPSILNDQLADIYPAKLYNYSFTVYNSPFGPAYLESIKKKLANYDRKRCFIITVDPWSIASDIKDPNNISKFIEQNNFIKKVSFVNSNPNFEYLFNWFIKSYYEIILMRLKNKFSKLDENGWYLTGVNLEKGDYSKQRNLKIEFYNDYLRKYSFSEVRYEYLARTIEFLKSKGDVYLVRLPVHEDIYNIETKVDPLFNDKIESLSNKYGVSYFNFIPENEKYIFKDGVHLDKYSAELFSIDLSKTILKPLIRP